jgi:hypothetical protein
MRRLLWLMVGFALISTGSVSAKDMFTLNGNSKGPVELQVTVSSNPREGYIREAGDYSHGETHKLGRVNCGRTERYFEVWSRRNFSTSAPPGVPVGKLYATFSLVGGNGSVEVRRDVKSTLKERSHWKGQDFGLVINLSCG